MPYEAWIKPVKGEWQFVASGFNNASDALDSVEPFVEVFAPCESFVFHTETKEIRTDLICWFLAGFIVAPCGMSDGRATYSDEDGAIWVGFDPKDCPFFAGENVTREELIQQAEQILDDMRLPNANGRVYLKHHDEERLRVETDKLKGEVPND